MNITKIARPFFLRRAKEIELYNNETVAIQRRVLRRLLQKAQDTDYGRNHSFITVASYEQFVQNVPVNGYDDLKGDIESMRHGEENILWPGQVKWYAKSSGTTNDKSKFIPVSNDGLQKIHYAGGNDVVALYLKNNPDSK